MEAYDAAVLSYALATAATKIKPTNLLGVAQTGGRIAADNESLTPPTRHDNNHPPENNDTNRNYLYQLLSNLEQQIISKTPIALNQLMEICATKQTQVDQQVIAHLESLQTELKQICKSNPGITQQLLLKIEDDGDDGNQGVSLKTEVVCKSLSELLKQFRLVIGANVIKKLFGN